MTVAAFRERNPSTGAPDALAVLYAVQTGGTLEAGHLVERVTGEGMPREP